MPNNSKEFQPTEHADLANDKLNPIIKYCITQPKDKGRSEKDFHSCKCQFNTKNKYLKIYYIRKFSE